MSNVIYIDTILQIFESQGNFHLVAGCTSGSTDPTGRDVINPAIHLVMPIDFALKKIPELSAVLPELIIKEKNEQEKKHLYEKVESDGSFEGTPIHIMLG
jgi:hypothetical protein